MPKPSVHLVRVTTDDREHQLWAVASSRAQAVTLVLNAVPEGWTAALLSNRLKPEELEILNLGRVRFARSRTLLIPSDVAINGLVLVLGKRRHRLAACQLSLRLE